MKLSLSKSAVEEKMVCGKKNIESIYIGNYFNEYATKGRKYFSIKERQSLKDGELIEIQKGSTRFENFILTKIQVLDIFKEIQEFKEIQDLDTLTGYSGSKRPPSPDEIDHPSPDENDQVSPVEVDHLI